MNGEPTPAAPPLEFSEAGLAEFLDRCGAGEAFRARREVMERFFADLTEFNSHTNLTRIVEHAEFWVKHVADSLAAGLVLPELLAQPLRAADVGCGAGFPYFPLGWANPELRLTGIEVNTKKVEFLVAETARLGFGRCNVLGRQAREVGRLPEHAGAYGAVVARAVSNPANLVKESRLLLAPGAALLVYSTPIAVRENFGLARREANKYGLSMSTSETIELPCGAGQRQFFLFRRPA
jgi:16S rRNA (guanine527-N7)-methyltransferase